MVNGLLKLLEASLFKHDEKQMIERFEVGDIVKINGSFIDTDEDLYDVCVVIKVRKGNDARNKSTPAYAKQFATIDVFSSGVVYERQLAMLYTHV